MPKRHCPGDILYDERLLARSWIAGTPNQPLSVWAKIYTPSSRLSCFVAIAFEPDAQRDISSYDNPDDGLGFPASSVVAYYGYHRDRYGKLARSKAIGNTLGYSLPDARELDTNYPLVEVRADLAVPGEGALRVLGDWILTVEWEPNMCIPPDELCHLFELCDVQVHHMGVLSGGSYQASNPPFTLIQGGA